MAGDRSTQVDGSPEAAAPSGRAGAILARLERAGLNRPWAATAFVPLVAAAVTLWLVIPTLAPGMVSSAGGDTAEFQTVGPVLGTAHPTGYPAYVILGFIASHLLPFGEPAYRMNLLQAILAAGAVAGTVAIVQFLTGMRWIALATGLLLLVMPTFSPVSVSFPTGMSIDTSPVFWRLSTYADPHMFHLALVTLIVLLLLVWERRRSDRDPERRRRADRWLVAAAGIYGVAVANHSLSLLLALPIGLFVLAVAPLILFRWRLVLTCAAVLGATVVVLFAELPIRAAMNAPLVYAHPDTWSGFWYVVLGQQFGVGDVWSDLGVKYAAVMNLISSWLGPLGYLAALGLGTSLARRPRYVLLSVLAAVVTAGFSAAYVNSDLERYFLVPVFVAFTFVGLGLADAVSLGVWLAGVAASRFAPGASRPNGEAAEDIGPPGLGGSDGEADHEGGSLWQAPALLAVEVLVAASLLVANVAVVPERQHVPDGDHPGGVSQSDQTGRETWMRAVLASPAKGGLPANAVIVSNWYDSTALWYGQKVEGLRPDIYIVDDSMRVPAGDNLGEVWDVIDHYLGQRPVFLLRFSWGYDGLDALSTMYDLKDFTLIDGSTIPQVISKKGTS
ncbi:MAG: DUF2723 domain-containing protein [Candidatus Limnocylindrales bacterium]